METQITVNCRIEELEPNEQVSIIQLINHLASAGPAYREDAFSRIEKMNSENPLTHFCGSNVKEGEETQVKVHWNIKYLEETTETVIVKEGQDIQEQLTTAYPSNNHKSGECDGAYIWQVTDMEGNVLWSL